MRHVSPFCPATLITSLLCGACASPAPAVPDAPRVVLDEYDAVYCRAVGEGEPVLVVPGAAWLEADAGALAPPGRVVFYDLRGRGRSTPRQSPAAATLEGDVADLELLRLRLGVERISLFGWSYEAAVAVRYALAYSGRVERLVLVSPVPLRRDPHWEKFRRRYSDRVTDADLARIERLATRGAAARRTPAYHRAVLAALFRGYGGDPATPTTMAGDPYPEPNADPDAAATLRRAIHEALGNWDWTAELAGLDVPVLVVHGGRSSLPRAAAEEYVDALPRAELVVLEDAAHFPWLETPAAFFAAVNAFLDAPR